MHKGVDFLTKALQGSWKKNSAIASNLANINTPGYKRVVVDFESALRREMELATMTVTNDKHYKNNQPILGNNSFIDGHSFRVDKNAVNIDVENAEMAKNSIYYNVVLNQINSQFARIKSAMKINK